MNMLFKDQRIPAIPLGKPTKASLFMLVIAVIWSILVLLMDWLWITIPGPGWLLWLWWHYRAWLGMAMLMVGTWSLGRAAPVWTSWLIQRRLFAKAMQLALIGCFVFAILSFLVSFIRTGPVPSFLWRTVALDPGKIIGEKGFAYHVDTHALALSGDEFPSPARLLQDGRMLKQDNASVEDIRGSGHGRFSFWYDYLLFSTSDNTNPASNGRLYSIQAPWLLVSPPVEWLLWTSTLSFGLLILKFRTRGAADLGEAVKKEHGAAAWAQTVESLVFGTKSWRASLARAICIAGPLFIFSFVAFGELPRVAVALIRSDALPVILATLIIFHLAYRAAGWTGALLSLGSTLILFALKLSGLWQAAASDGSIISGLLPWSDASGYYGGAQVLLAGGDPTSWHGRRPWFMGLLAVALGATHNNLQWALVILAAIVGVACVLLAREVQRSHGTLAAVIMLMVIVLFYTRFIGATLTEHLGLSLGAVALAILWRSAHKPTPGLYWPLGLLLLTIALTARAGAYLVLPALLIWGFWRYRHSPATAIKFLMIGMAGVAFGFLLDATLKHALVPNADSFGNFSYTIYGLVVGNKGWAQVMTDYPQIAHMSGTQASAEIYRLAWRAFLINPYLALGGMLGAWRDYFDSAHAGAFSFAGRGSTAHSLLYLLSGVGLTGCFRRWREGPHSMVLALVGGLLLSVPFAPPIDADFMRVYAATIPISALLVALGSAEIISIFGLAGLLRPPEPVVLKAALPIFSAALLILCFAGPIALRLSNHPAPYQPTACQDGQEALYVRLTPGASISLVEDAARSRSHIPEVRLSDFRKSIKSYSNSAPALLTQLEKLQPGQEIWSLVSLGSDRYGDMLWLITEHADTPSSGVVRVCAVASEPYHFYYAQTIQSVSSMDR